MNKELASIKEVTEITTKTGVKGYICKFESVTQIGTFYSNKALALDTEVMIQKNGNYFDYTEVATEAQAAKIKAASERIKGMWS